MNRMNRSAASSRVVAMTHSQIAGAVAVHRRAFAGYMNTRLGAGYVAAFIRWFVDSDDAVALVALDEHARVVGYLVGAPLRRGGAISRHMLVPGILAGVRRPWRALDRRIRRTALGRVGALLGRAMPSAPAPALPEPAWSLVGIGVDSAARGLGHGAALIRAFEQQARARGARALRLSVYQENAAARRLYERCGWLAHEVPPPPGFAMYYFKPLAEDAPVRARAEGMAP
jgi:ribosomal protein S18 acetylase RimI-like enzyme